MRVLALVYGLALGASAMPAGARGSPDARATVSRLYRDFAAEAQLATPPAGQAFADQPRAVLARYFDASLTDLLLAERACVTRSQAVCRLDFAPLWGSQDPEARDVSIRRTQNPAVIAVTLTGTEGSRSVELTYRLVRTRAGWRVHDVAYPQGKSLRQLLAGPPRK